MSGSFAYSEEGNYAVTVTVHDIGGQSTTISDTAVIADATLSASATQPTVRHDRGGHLPGSAVRQPRCSAEPVAQFTDANTAAPLSDFTATIDWGDGTPLVGRHGRSAARRPPRTFVVTGSHTYADSGVNGGIGNTTRSRSSSSTWVVPN